MKRYLRHVPALLGVALLVGAIYVVQREFRHLKLADIKASLAAIPGTALVISFAWTVLSYGVLTFYDRLGTIYAGHKVRYRRVAFASFCAYALSHNLGFAAVSGAAVRYRLYSHWGLTAVQIAKVVAFCSLTFGLGGLVLGGCILFFEPMAVPFFNKFLPLWAFYGIGAAMWLVVASYVMISRFAGRIRLRGHEFNLPDWRMAVVQVALASVDVAITAAIFYALLPPTPGLTYLRFLACYLASYSAGLLANLPGGIGVFDTAMLLGLEPYLPAPVVVGAILVFRLYYYVIPLFLAGSMFAGNEILLRGGALLKSGFIARGATSLGRISEPDFAVGAATGTVAMCGALLLSLGVLDDRPDFSWIDPDFADMAASAGQFVPSLIGAALMTLAIGLSQRVTLAWGADHRAAADRGRLHGGAGRPDLDPGRAGVVRRARGAVSRRVLPPRPAADGHAAGGRADPAHRACGVRGGAGRVRAAGTAAERELLVGDRALAGPAEQPAHDPGGGGAAGGRRDAAAAAAGSCHVAALEG